MDPKEAVSYLRSPKAIRDQCGRLHALAQAGRLTHFTLRQDKVAPAADYVLAVIRASYPDLVIPYHSRWRHFDAPRLARLEEKLKGKSPEDIGRAKMELAIVSVLLDAGAGPRWSYKDETTGTTIGKSEGLAAASFEMFLDGGFSSDPDDPCRVDPAGLRLVGKNELAAYFQVSAQNQLAGFDGRLALLHKLGNAITLQKKIFGDIEPRLGGIFDYCLLHSGNLKLPARKVLGAVLEGLGTIWPGRVTLGGTNLGDVWKHPALPQDDAGHGLVPFHKLSQWLTYSLVEPLEEAGIEVGAMDELTGLAEYRNGGLFLDLGVLEPKSSTVTTATHKPDSDVIVEWRAMTIVLLDEVADHIRKTLKMTSLELPLAKVLQGGTWTAGRKVALERRADGGPPIKLASDGTVF